MKRSGIVKLLLLVGLPAMALACSSDATGPSDDSATPVASVWLNPLGTVASCAAQPFAKATKVIGPLGGYLQAGKHKFTIPKGALLLPVEISMEAVSDTVRSVRFSPEGLVFNPLYPPTLKLDYKGCNLPQGAKTKVAWTTEQLLILQTLRTSNDSVNGSADADLQHFSRYALAY